jgi:cytochrome c
MPRLSRLGVIAASVAWLGVLTGISFSSQPDGKMLFEKRCGGCHALDRDKEGPRLGGVYGRTAGSIESFQYSDALKNSKVTWTEDTLNSWLTDTEKVVPNNDMSFRVDNAEERREIIAYLKTSPTTP